MKIQEDLIAIYNTLNLIEIKGEQNVVYMYGVITLLKQIINEQKNEVTQKDSSDK